MALELLSKNIALLTFLYFIQGLPYGFQASFLPMYLRMQGVSLTNLGLFKLLLAPWMCKALWAPLIDKQATKRKWLLWSVSGLVFTCAFASLSSPTNLFVLCFIVFFLNLFAATQDIAVDGIAVALLRLEELGKGNTAQVVGYKLGSIFGGGVLVWFMDSLGWSGLFLVLTLLYIEALLFIYLSPTLRNLHIHHDDVQHSRKLQNKRDATLQHKDEILEGKAIIKEAEFRSEKLTVDKEIKTSNESQQCEEKNDSADGSDSTRSDSFELVENDHVPCFDGITQSEGQNKRTEDSMKPDVQTPFYLDSEEEDEKNKTDGTEEIIALKDVNIGVASVIKQRNTNETESVKTQVNESEEHTIDFQGEYEKEILKMSADEFEPIDKVSEMTSCFIGGKLEFIHEVLCVPGTMWLLVYVLIYKLGEQGAIGMLPLFLVDKKIKTSDTTFWMGVIGQAVSIAGSCLSGYVLSKFRFPTSLFLQQLTLCRLVPMGITLWIVALWQWKMLPAVLLYYLAILAAMLMLLISGMVTTATFTFMMQCSQGATTNIQATHYTFLATLEVIGKLTFMSIAGWLVDIFDYAPMYLVFTGLAAANLVWFRRLPRSLNFALKFKKS